MEEIFVDSAFWIAAINKNDNLHDSANEAQESVSSCRWVTAECILFEVFAKFSKEGSFLRGRVAEIFNQIIVDKNILVLPQTRDAMIEAIDFYESRDDKKYSLADCLAMCIMKQRGITRILTSDQDFEIEGFQILMK